MICRTIQPRFSCYSADSPACAISIALQQSILGRQRTRQALRYILLRLADNLAEPGYLIRHLHPLQTGFKGKRARTAVLEHQAHGQPQLAR